MREHGCCRSACIVTGFSCTRLMCLRLTSTERRAGCPQADAHDETGIAGLSDGVVAASSFRTAYVPLSSQDDFISGLTVHTTLFCSFSVTLAISPARAEVFS
jgi:hypothetical protein